MWTEVIHFIQTSTFPCKLKPFSLKFDFNLYG